MIWEATKLPVASVGNREFLTRFSKQKGGGPKTARPSLFGVGGCLAVAVVITVIAVMIAVEVEEIEEVSDGRAVERHIGIVVVRHRVGEIVAAAVGQRLQLPVAFDELEDDYGP
jgi:hypothetical protein